VTKNEKRHTVGTVPNSDSKIVEGGKLDTLTLGHKYTSAYFPGFIQALLR